MFDCGDGCGLCFRLCDLYFFGWIVVGVNGGEYIGVGGLFVFSGKFVVLYWCFCQLLVYQLLVYGYFDDFDQKDDECGEGCECGQFVDWVFGVDCFVEQ